MLESRVRQSGKSNTSSVSGLLRALWRGRQRRLVRRSATSAPEVLEDRALLTVNIGATQTVQVINDADADNVADPSETLRYTVDITNSGDMDATDVQFADILDTNTTLVPGSITVTPIAFDDAYAVTGNVPITVNAVSGVLGNDVDPDHDTAPLTNTDLVIQTFSTIGTQGTVSLNNDGSFTYTPPTGFTGSDTFTYTVQDQDGLGSLVNGLVTFTVSDMVWFIDNTDTGTNDGSFANPFQSIGDFNGSVEPGVNDLVFVGTGTGTYTTGVNLQDGQALIGEGVDLATQIGAHGITLAPFSTALPAAGVSPLLTNAAGNGVNLASGNTVRGLDIGNTSGFGINATANVGTLSIDNVGISGTGGGINLPAGGTAAITFDSLSTTSHGGTFIDLDQVGGSFSVSNPGPGADVDIMGSATGIQVTNAAGSASFGFGEVSSSTSGTGIDLASSGSATFTFDGLGVTTTAGDGFRAAMAGTVNITGDNSVNVTGGVGISVTDSAAGPSGVDFGDVTVGGGAATDGIVLNNNTGTFTFDSLNVSVNGATAFRSSNSGTVNFNTTAASVSAINGAAIDITGTSGQTNSAPGWTFGSVTSSNSPADAVRFTNLAGGVSVSNIDVDNPVGNGLNFDTITGDVTVTSGRIDGNDTDEHGIRIDSVTGTSTVRGTSNTIGNRFLITNVGTTGGVGAPDKHDGIEHRSSGDLVVQFVEIDDVGSTASEHGIHIFDPISPGAGATRSLSITDSVFANIGDTSILGSGNGVNVRLTPAANFTGILDVSVTGNDINGDGVAFNTTKRAVFLDIASSPTATLHANLNNNDIDGTSWGIKTLILGGVGSGADGRNIVNIQGNMLDDLDNNGIEIDVGNATLQPGGSNTRAVVSGNVLNAITNYTGVPTHDPDEAIEAVVRGDSTDGTILSVDITQNIIDSFSAVVGERWDGNGIVVGTSATAPTLNAIVTADVHDNTVNNVEDRGIQLEADAAATVNVRVTDNVLGFSQGLRTVLSDAGYTFRTFFGGNNPGSWDLGVNLGIWELGVTSPNAQIGNTLNSPADDALIASLLAGEGNDTTGFSIDPLSAVTIIDQATLTGANLQAADWPCNIPHATADTLEDTTVSTTPATPTPVNDSPVSTATPTAPTSDPVVAPLSETDAEFTATADYQLTTEDLAPIVAAAIARWEATGLSPSQVEALEAVEITISDLSDRALGVANGYHVELDVDAGGWGWFVDDSPLDDAEFGEVVTDTRSHADADSPASDGMDLLTTVMHELGHVLGLVDLNPLLQPNDLMSGLLTTGQRRLPVAGQADGAIPGSVEGWAFIGSPIDLGTLPAGKSVRIVFDADIDDVATLVTASPLAPTITNTGTVSGSNFANVNTNTTSTTVDSLTLSNLVFLDNDISSTFNTGDVGVDDVTVNLFADDGDGVLDAGDGPALLTVMTAGGGFYAFNGLLPGDYIVEVDAAELGAGGDLFDLDPSPVDVDPDNDIDHDNNGALVAGFGVASQAITLGYHSETTADGTGRLDINDTLDLGFADINSVDLSVSTGTGTEAAGTVVTVTATAERVVLGNQTVDVAVTGTGILAGDFLLSATTITIPDGQMTGSVTFTIQDDSIVEANETATLTISNPSAGIGIGSTAVQTVTITDDDATTVSVAANDATAGEPTDNGQFTVTLDGGKIADTGGVVVNYSVSGSAGAGDFTALTGSVTIAGGASSATIDVTTTDDAIVEASETVIVMVTGTDNINVTPAANPNDTGTVTIADDDATTVSIAATDAAASENGDPGQFTVTLDGGRIADTGGIVVNYTIGGTAAGGTDYNALSGMVTIAAGTGSATIDVTPIDDAIVELDQTVIITLTETDNGSVTVAGSPSDEATVTIADDDATTVSITANDSTAAEPMDPGQFTVTLDNARVADTGGLTVTYTIGGTAIGGTDYTALTGSVTIAEGTSTATIDVAVSDDNIVEGDETVVLTVTGTSHIGATPATVPNNEATVTIGDDDATTVSIEATDSTGLEGADDAQFTVTLANGRVAGPGGIEVAYTVGGTATNGSDYTTLPGTVTIPEGSSSATIDVVVNDELIVELAETVIVTLTGTNQAGATIAAGPDDMATVAIGDNDAAVIDVNVSDIDEATGTMDFIITLSSQVDTDVTLQFDTLVGSAIPGVDFTAIVDQLVTFPALTTTAQTVTVTVNDENLVEADETVIGEINTVVAAGRTVVLESGGVTDSATGTIVNDDLALVSIINEPIKNEGDTGQRKLRFTLMIDNPVDRTVNVRYTTLDGSATAADGDYIARTYRVRFDGTAGQTKTISIRANGDTSVEFDESFTFRLTGRSRSRNVKFGKRESPGTIVNDDAGSAVNGDTLLVVADDTGQDVLVEENANHVRVDIDGVRTDFTEPITQIVILGGTGDDTIRHLGGGSTPMFVNAAGGNDLIDGGNGNDILIGASGNDIIDGDGGDDQLDGGSGNDDLQGQDGNDIVNGGRGGDTVRGNHGDDIVHGGAGGDTVFGDDQRDVLIGGVGRDNLSGGAGEDIVIAGDVTFTLAGLENVRAEWSSARDYATRIDNLRNGTSPIRNNGSTFLIAGTTVLDDGIGDSLTGNGQLDWFFAALNDTTAGRQNDEELDLL